MAKETFHLCDNCRDLLGFISIDNLIGTWTGDCDHCGNDKGQVLNVLEDAVNPVEILRNHGRIIRKNKLEKIIKKL